jgi:hypothetical protein
VSNLSQRALARTFLALLVASSWSLVGVTPLSADEPLPDPFAIFIETTDLDTYDHGILWVVEVIDSTSIPQPDDFTLAIDGMPESITDVELVYQGLVGAPLAGEIGLTQGMAFLELRWTTDAPPEADIRLGYTPGDHPIRTPDGRQMAPFTDMFLDRFDAGDFGLAFVDEGAGPDQLVVFLGWQSASALPAPGDFAVSATSWASQLAPANVIRRAEHLGATFLYLELPQDVLYGDLVTLDYTPGANPLTDAEGSPLEGFTDLEIQVSVVATPSRATPLGSDVVVSPPDAATGGSFVTVEFDSVTGGGTTTLTTTETAPALPAGFTVGDPPTYYEIATTATFAGTATVCIRYGAADYTAPGDLVLLHFEGGTWVPAANQTHDPDTQTICGDVTSFSPFAVAQSSFAFTGFFSPVDNSPVVNVANGGKAIPVKFSLGGNFGLGILAGTPVTRRVACESGAPVDLVEQTVNTNGPSLTYDAGSNRYQFVLKSEKSWAGSCRELILRFTDGTTEAALFQFK